MKPENIKITPRWSKSKEEIWKETFAELNDIPTSRKMPHITMVRSIAAAVVVLLIGVTTASLYRVTKIVPQGVHLTVILPDGSKAILNADSKLTYHPCRWFISRCLKLDGEAYFEVKKGETFSVLSNGNRVNVLGTTFNVFSRPEKYSVTCLSGKVEVITQDDVNILEPGVQLTRRKGNLTIGTNTDEEGTIGWIANKFVFTGVPLADVVKELERQYNIQIIANASLDHSYTGIFERRKDPGEILEIIGKPFGITFSIKEK